ncbi:MAG: M23 family metallopeptidase [Candidatus Korarchaeota archaeon]|nr:M23 family metallopeptidase [Candidatus Korarchaeota archaeon]
MGELKFMKPVDYKAGDKYGDRGGTQYGKTIIIDYTPIAGKNVRHIYTLSAHLDKRSVSNGQKVKKGDEIGKSGNSGM